MNKAFTRINWENLPSTATPIDEDNLNAVDSALDTIDDRVITLDTSVTSLGTSKANQSDLLQTLKEVSYNTSTGVWTFTKWNGTVITYDQNVEKIPVSFSMSEQGVITMTTADGTQYTADIKSLIKLYTFTDTSDIDFTTTTDSSGNKTITATIPDGAITQSKLDPDYLAEINTKVSTATTAATNAASSATSAQTYANTSKSYAIGEGGSRQGEATDNAKYYKEQAELSASSASTNATSASSSASTATSAKNTVLDTKDAIDVIKAQIDTIASQVSADATSASSSATSASNSASSANDSANTAKSYAIGQGGVRPNEANDNAKKYSELAYNYANTAGGYMGDAQYYASQAASAATEAAQAVVAELPKPMLFKGTLGTGGTITSLPTAAATNEGWMYKVITAGTYGGQLAVAGDEFISDGTEWVYIPSGDEPSGTVTSIATGTGLTGGTITSSGTIKANLKSETAWDKASDYDASGNTNRLYAVGVDNTGKLAVGVPWENNTWRGIQDNLTSSSNTTESLSAKQGYLLANGSARDNTKVSKSGDAMSGDLIFESNGDKGIHPNVSGYGHVGDNTHAFKEGYINTVYAKDIYYGSSRNVKLESKSASSGGTATSLVTTGEKYTWNNKASKDTATQSADGLMSSSDKTKLDGVATNANNYSLPLAASGTRGGVQLGYTQSGKNYPVQESGEKAYVNVPWENTTYESKSASSGGTAVSLVTTGEKYTWNNNALSISSALPTGTINRVQNYTWSATLNGIPKYAKGIVFGANGTDKGLLAVDYKGILYVNYANNGTWRADSVVYASQFPEAVDSSGNPIAGSTKVQCRVYNSAEYILWSNLVAAVKANCVNINSKKICKVVLWQSNANGGGLFVEFIPDVENSQGNISLLKVTSNVSASQENKNPFISYDPGGYACIWTDNTFGISSDTNLNMTVLYYNK